MKKNYFLFLGLSFLSGLAWAGFPLSFNSGSSAMSKPGYQGSLSAGYLSGVVTGDNTKMQLGYFYVVQPAYDAFLETDLPFKVRPEPAQAASSKFIISPDRTMRFSWSDGRNQLPVRYRVYFGEHPNSLFLAGTTSDRFFMVRDLTYLVDYMWRIETFDVYGRSAMSNDFSFSIAPGVGNAYCAPNPFRAGSEATTFIFQMPGPGVAKLSLYSLPHIDLVYSVSLNGLQDGVNTFVYNGTDNNGRTLYNGVYLAVLNMKGLTGNVKQKFRFIVAK